MAYREKKFYNNNNDDNNMRHIQLPRIKQLKIGGERSSASQFPGGTTTSIYGQFFPLRCQRRRSATHLGTLLTALLALPKCERDGDGDVALGNLPAAMWVEQKRRTRIEEIHTKVRERIRDENYERSSSSASVRSDNSTADSEKYKRRTDIRATYERSG
ncbi:hypothetical protein V9T40_007667 [Parthenolecanium corni]|uniref:Uncharacterized protein n=1 Tax=Parthenolecanium corni TaxID=536013 RepID=A0AAN9Y563_9HEMI